MVGVKETVAARLIKISACLLVAVSLLACDGAVLHEYRSLGGQWRCGDTLLFTHNFAHSGLFDVYVGVRYNASYTYKNLWVEVENSVGDSIVQRDTVCCAIYNDDGRRNGSTAGALYQKEFYSASVNIKSDDTHNIRVRHIMADTLLRGVYNVGVKVVPLGRHLCAEN